MPAGISTASPRICSAALDYHGGDPACNRRMPVRIGLARDEERHNAEVNPCR